MSTKGLCLLALVALAGALSASPKDQSATNLTGMVTSDAEGHMGGVLVTTRAEGANMTVTVISDDRGRCAFPSGKLQPGKYTLTIRAVGYELSGQIGAEIKPDKAAHVDINLGKKRISHRNSRAQSG
jgi:virginiamycin B lyase